MSTREDLSIPGQVVAVAEGKADVVDDAAVELDEEAVDELEETTFNATEGVDVLEEATVPELELLELEVPEEMSFAP